MTPPIKVADIVEVRQAVRSSTGMTQDVWERAQIVAVQADRIGVRFMRRTAKLIWLRVDERKRTWRSP